MMVVKRSSGHKIMQPDDRLRSQTIVCASSSQCANDRVPHPAFCRAAHREAEALESQAQLALRALLEKKGLSFSEGGEPPARDLYNVFSEACLIDMPFDENRHVDLTTLLKDIFVADMLGADGDLSALAVSQAKATQIKSKLKVLKRLIAASNVCAVLRWSTGIEPQLPALGAVAHGSGSNQGTRRVSAL